MKSRTASAVVAVLTLATLVACGDDGGGSSNSDAAQVRGPISIWYSNNEQEVAWGKQVVEAWNAAHADQKVTAQEIPAGTTSEAVIGAAITAGNAPQGGGIGVGVISGDTVSLGAVEVILRVSYCGQQPCICE